MMTIHHALQLPCMCMLQVLHFRIVLEEYQRMLQGIMVDLQAAVQSVAACSLSAVVEELMREKQQQQQQQPPGSQITPQSGASTAADHPTSVSHDPPASQQEALAAAMAAPTACAACSSPEPEAFLSNVLKAGGRPECAATGSQEAMREMESQADTGSGSRQQQMSAGTSPVAARAAAVMTGLAALDSSDNHAPFQNLTDVQSLPAAALKQLRAYHVATLVAVFFMINSMSLSQYVQMVVAGEHLMLVAHQLVVPVHGAASSGYTN
jgi:hypothetical protein